MNTTADNPNPANTMRNDTYTPLPTVGYTRYAMDRIRKTVGSLPAESGCLLLGYEHELNQDRIIIRDIIFDEGARTTAVTYTLNTAYLNPLIRKAWEEKGLSVIGVAHSHPYGCNYPSWPDIQYFRNMFHYMPRKYLVTPIIFTDPDGGFRPFVYVLTGPTSNPVPVAYEVIEETEEVQEIQPVVKQRPCARPIGNGRKYLQRARRTYLLSRRYTR